MAPSVYEYKNNVSSEGAIQTIIRDVYIRLPRALGKRTKAFILALVIFTAISVPAITVPVYLKVHLR